MPAHQSAVAKVQPFVENLPEFLLVLAGRKRHVHQIDGNDALIESAVILRFSVLVHIRRQKAAAAHTGIAMPFAVLVHLVFQHLLFGNIIGHHSLRRTFRRQLGQIPIFRIFRDIIGFQHVNQLRESGRNPHARFVFHALNPLRQRFFDNHGKVRFFLLAARLVQVHEHRNERRLPVGGKQSNHLILYHLNTLSHLVAKAFFGNLSNVRLVRDIHQRQFVRHFFADFFTADIHERRKMRQRNALPAVLVGSHLRDNLRSDIARRRKAVRLFDQRTGNHGAVLKHIFQIHEVAVVHVLRKIIRVVEMNNPLVVRRHDIFGQQNTARQILGNFARHIIALHAVHRGVLIRIFLFHFLVVAFDQRKNMRVRRVRLSRQRAVRYVLPRKRESVHRHQTVLHHILNFFHGNGAPHVIALFFHVGGKSYDFVVRNFRKIVHLLVRAAYRMNDFISVEYNFLSVSFNNLHSLFVLPFFLPRRYRKKYTPRKTDHRCTQSIFCKNTIYSCDGT